jgi:Protein of unknown function (DUF3298).
MPAKVFLSAFLLLFVLTLPVAPAAAQYQLSRQIVDALEDSWDETQGRMTQPKVPGLTAAELGAPVENEATGSKMDLKLYYPQGTGQAKVDLWLKNYAEKKLAEYQAEAREFVAAKQAQPGWKGLIFVASRPSEDYLSVVFYESGYTGGAHGYKSYDIVTFDLAAGRPLTMKDIFHNPDDDDERGLDFFVNYVNAALDQRCFELYKDSVCRPNSLSLEAAAGGLKNLAFTPHGLAVIYSPYEQGSYAEGTKYVDIPKSEFLAWGLPDHFWK